MLPELQQSVFKKHPAIGGSIAILRNFNYH
jgi:hypothetical protein